MPNFDDTSLHRTSLSILLTRILFSCAISLIQLFFLLGSQLLNIAPTIHHTNQYTILLHSTNSDTEWFPWGFSLPPLSSSHPASRKFPPSPRAHDLITTNGWLFRREKRHCWDLRRHFIILNRCGRDERMPPMSKTKSKSTRRTRILPNHPLSPAQTPTRARSLRTSPPKLRKALWKKSFATRNHHSATKAFHFSNRF